MFKSLTLILVFLILVININNVVLETKLQQRNKYDQLDYIFDLAGSQPLSQSSSGYVKTSFVDKFPALSGEGVGMALFQIEPCGTILPHIHPRGSELVYVFSSRFRVVVIDENTGKTVVNNITPGQTTIFPQGLIHTLQNVGCEQGIMVSAFSNEDPGILGINRVFTLPDEILTSAFNSSLGNLNSLKSHLPGSPAPGTQECLSRCAKLKSSTFSNFSTTTTSTSSSNSSSFSSTLSSNTSSVTTASNGANKI